MGPGAVAQSRAVLDQPGARDVQVLENARLPGLQRLGLKGECRAHPRQHLCIHRVGLGSRAMRLGEPTRLQRVHLDQGKRRAKRRLERLVIWPRRLEHDPCHRCLAKPFAQRPKSRRRVREALCRAIFQPERIQMGFRNVHANGVLYRLRHVLCLSCVMSHTRIRWGGRPPAASKCAMVAGVETLL